MRSHRTIGLLTKVFLGVSLLFGVMTFAGTTAQAQHRHRGRVIVVSPRIYPRPFYRPYWGSRVYYTPLGRVTTSQGYRDGLNDGKDDAKHNKGYRPESHNDYKSAQTSDYFDAYVRGYEEGYRQRMG